MPLRCVTCQVSDTTGLSVACDVESPHEEEGRLDDLNLEEHVWQANLQVVVV